MVIISIPIKSLLVAFHILKPSNPPSPPTITEPGHVTPNNTTVQSCGTEPSEDWKNTFRHRRF